MNLGGRHNSTHNMPYANGDATHDIIGPKTLLFNHGKGSLTSLSSNLSNEIEKIL